MLQSFCMSVCLYMHVIALLAALVHVVLMCDFSCNFRVDAKLSLSTATPSIGGVVPVLETCNLSLRRPEVMTRRVLQYNSMEIPRGATFISSAPSMKKAVPLKKPQAEVKEGLSSSVFEIETRATIPSDSSQHKVCL